MKASSQVMRDVRRSNSAPVFRYLTRGMAVEPADRDFERPVRRARARQQTGGDGRRRAWQDNAAVPVHDFDELRDGWGDTTSPAARFQKMSRTNDLDACHKLHNALLQFSPLLVVMVLTVMVMVLT